MSEHAWQWVEAFAQWLLAWSVVLGVVSSYLVLTNVRRPGIRYVGWLLATFSGVVLLPVVISLSPVVSWRQITGYTGEIAATEAGLPGEVPVWPEDHFDAGQVASGASDYARHHVGTGSSSLLNLLR